MSETEYTVVYRAPNETTANIVRAALEDAGISALVQAHHSSWFDGAFLAAEGSWGDVLVPIEHCERAKELLDRYTQAAESTDEEAQP